MKYGIGVDTSLSKFAITVIDLDTKEIVNSLLVRSGDEKVKKKLNCVSYFVSTYEQIYYVVDSAIDFLRPYFSQAEYLAIEGLSFASVGNATRDLAGVFHAFMYALVKNGFDRERIHVYSPQTLKKHAKLLLGASASDLSGKEYCMAAADLHYKDFLSQFVKSAASERSGKEDFSDSLIANLLSHSKQTKE